MERSCFSNAELEGMEAVPLMLGMVIDDDGIYSRWMEVIAWWW